MFYAIHNVTEKLTLVGFVTHAGVAHLIFRKSVFAVTATDMLVLLNTTGEALNASVLTIVVSVVSFSLTLIVLVSLVPVVHPPEINALIIFPVRGTYKRCAELPATKPAPLFGDR